jgi:SWI/SNF-related matrix-associated actin-dependent regulator of chromatin subfamily A member 5
LAEQVTLQAEARAHRIGQQKKVTIYKLCTQGTVEEQMMGRIRKKLYLSTKITESMRTMFGEHVSDTGGTTLVGGDAPEMNTSQLKSLVRRGAQTLSHPEIDVTEMLSWDLETMLKKCRDKPADPHQNSNTDNVEVDEEKWLSVIERVETAVFDGKRYQRKLDKGPKSATDISNIREDRRQRKEMTVMVDGYEVSKESLNCAQWEAVPTLAGKDPRLADAVREKRHEWLHEEHCLVCFNGPEIGHMVQCKSCPRALHFDCLDEDYQEKVKGFAGFFCPQHYCSECGKNTTDAGGLMYRCRWCPRGFCEDCIEWGKEDSELIGENLPEFEMMHQPSAQTGFYIKCPDCVDTMQEDQAKSEWIANMETTYAKQHEEWFKEQEEEQQRVEQQQDAAQESRSMHTELPKPSNYLQVPLSEDERGSTPSLTENSTANDESGLTTPRVQRALTPSKKRMTRLDSYSAGSPQKRARPAQRAWTGEIDLSDDGC